jgi:hypothetical protein
MEEFHNRDNDYYRWNSQNPDGYVLHQVNRKTYTLHHAQCPAVASISVSHATKTPKLCGAEGEVMTWARGKGAKVIRGCEQCN